MKNFIRRRENFRCEVCGEENIGDGYTDHCNICLWGKHVDRDVPGDRASKCGGLMEPTRVIFEKGEYKIYYKCQKCGYEFRVRAAKNDNAEILLKLCGER